MHDFQSIAPLLNAMKFDPGARAFYDLFAGGLIWTDETPPPNPEPAGEPIAWMLRGIWHYRMSVILGKPAEDFKRSWDEARGCFPDWPGFHPGRRDPCLATMAGAMREAAMRSWTEWESRFEQLEVTNQRQASA